MLQSKPFARKIAKENPTGIRNGSVIKLGLAESCIENVQLLFLGNVVQ